MYVDLIGAYQQRHGRELPERVKAQNERLQQQAKEASAEAAERLAQRRERERARARERYHRARQRERETAQREQERRLAAVTEVERVRAVLAAMPVDERISYELEQVLPLTEIAGATDEDLDPTPVPKGCPSCWRTNLRNGELCIKCPDPTAHARRRQERKQGLALRAS